MFTSFSGQPQHRCRRRHQCPPLAHGHRAKLADDMFGDALGGRRQEGGCPTYVGPLIAGGVGGGRTTVMENLGSPVRAGLCSSREPA